MSVNYEGCPKIKVPLSVILEGGILGLNLGGRKRRVLSKFYRHSKRELILTAKFRNPRPGTKAFF